MHTQPEPAISPPSEPPTSPPSEPSTFPPSSPIPDMSGQFNSQGSADMQSFTKMGMDALNTIGITSIAVSAVIAAAISNLFHSHLPLHLHVISLFCVCLFFSLPRRLSQTTFAACILIVILSTQYALVSAPTNATDEVKQLLASRVVYASIWINIGIVLCVSLISAVCVIVFIVLALCSFFFFFSEAQSLPPPVVDQPPNMFSRLRGVLLSYWWGIFSLFFSTSPATPDSGSILTFSSSSGYAIPSGTELYRENFYPTPLLGVIASCLDVFFTCFIVYIITPKHPPFPSAVKGIHVAENILLYGIAAGTGLATVRHLIPVLCGVRMMTDVKAAAYKFAAACVAFLSDVCVYMLVGIFVCSSVIDGFEWRDIVGIGITLVVLDRCLSWLVRKKWIIFGRAVVVSCLVYICAKRYGEIVGKD